MLKDLEGRIAFHLQRAMITRMFKERLGYAGNFENPKTYQEKLQFRKLYGNHAFYAAVTDKHAVRDYVAERIGRKYLIPLLGVYDRLDASIFAGLPDEFIIKANHGCKWNRVVRDKSKLDVAETVRYFNQLCGKRLGWVAGERHYNFIRPKIVIEQLLRDPDGELPWDYNFFCYNSPKGFDCSLAITAPDGAAAIFDKNWRILENDIPGPVLASHAMTESLGEMLSVARRLSADFDFVRMDLYAVAGAVYFGELTCTPGQGFVPDTNQEKQHMRTTMWHVDVNNPLLYCPPGIWQPCDGEWGLLAKYLRPKWLGPYLRRGNWKL